MSLAIKYIVEKVHENEKVTFTLDSKDNINYSTIDIKFTNRDDMSRVDISPIININTYSSFLMANLEKSLEIIDDFVKISNLNIWLLDEYLPNIDNVVERHSDIVDLVHDILDKIAKRHDFILNVKNT